LQTEAFHKISNARVLVINLLLLWLLQKDYFWVIVAVGGATSHRFRFRFLYLNIYLFLFRCRFWFLSLLACCDCDKQTVARQQKTSQTSLHLLYLHQCSNVAMFWCDAMVLLLIFLDTAKNNNNTRKKSKVKSKK